MSNVETLVIETNIPAPIPGRHGKYAEILPRFQPGQSIAFKSIQNAQSFEMACRKTGYKTTRRAIDGVTRVWRVA